MTELLKLVKLAESYPNWGRRLPLSELQATRPVLLQFHENRTAALTFPFY